MARFQYKGRSGRGDAVSGKLEAESADAVAKQLFNAGITPLEIVPAAAEARDLLPAFSMAKKVALDDVLLFTRQMYSLSKAGVPLISGLSSLAESTRSQVLAAALRDIIETLESGRDFSTALARHANIFPPLYISLIRVGENSGRLEESFNLMYAYLQREKHTGKQIKSALRYPITVLVAITIAIGVLAGFVIPAFSSIFDQLGGNLPLPTRVIMAVSDFVVGYWYMILLGGAAGFAAFILWKNTERGKYLWDRARFRFPLVGGIILRASLARFARAFSMTYRSGVPLSQGLTLVARAVDNEYLAEKVVQIRNGVERGESLSATAAAAGLFTPLVLQMLRVGEETGQVDDMLDEVGDFYEREVDYDIANLSALIEPIMIVALGGMVLVLALGIFLPMWGIFKLALH
jgi:MSHA biogenesis protein MshG